MAISTINQNGLTAPLTLTAPNLGTPSAINLSNATALPSAALPTGCVLQVVNAIYSTQVSTNNTNWTTTGHTISITPKSATSKIMIFVSAYVGVSQTNGAFFTVYRNSTNLATGTAITALAAHDVNGFAAQSASNVGINFLDSPATTSATTYTVYFQAANASYAAYYCYTLGSGLNTTNASLTVMEIAG